MDGIFFINYGDSMSPFLVPIVLCSQEQIPQDETGIWISLEKLSKYYEGESWIKENPGPQAKNCEKCHRYSTGCICECKDPDATVYVLVDGCHHLNFETVSEDKPADYDDVMTSQATSYGEGFAFYDKYDKKAWWGHYCQECNQIWRCEKHGFFDSSIILGPFGCDINDDAHKKSKTEPSHYKIQEIPYMPHLAHIHDVGEEIVPDNRYEEEYFRGLTEFLTKLKSQ